MNIGNASGKFISAILGIVILLTLSVSLIPLVINATALVGAISGLPLASLFTGGIITLLVVVMVIYAIFKMTSVSK